MTIREIFSKEHSLFRELLDKLELDLARPQARARADVVAALRILLPALDRHEEIEDIVYARPADAACDNRKLLRAIEDQHRDLSVLRDDILFTLERSAQERPFARLSTLTRCMICDLRAHLKMEESLLWPLYRASLNRTTDEVLPIALRKRAEALEQELSRGIAALSSP